MLINFSVKNYKSYKDSKNISLELTQSVDKEDEGKFFDTTFKDLNLLNSLVIYGQNASGKTNLIKALFFVREFIKKAPSDGMPEDRIANDALLNSFKLNKETLTKPSEFEIDFIVEQEKEKIRCLFNFVADKFKVYKETLSIQGEKEKSFKYLYKRILKDKDSYEYKFNEKVELAQKLKKQSNNLISQTRHNSLFLSKLASENYVKMEIIESVYKWFIEKLFVFPKGTTNGGVTIEKIKQGGKEKDRVLDFLQAADFSIKDIELSEKQVSLQNQTTQEIKNITVFDIYTKHKVTGSNGYESLNLLTEESKGTQKVFELAGDWLNILDKGLTIFFDELDTSLHPDIVVFLIKLLQDKTKNKNNAQLVFTAHNTRFLSNNLKLFRKDQIYIVDKEKDQSSNLYNLVSFGGVQKKDSKENQYNAGRYGGKPYVFIDGVN